MARINVKQTTPRTTNYEGGEAFDLKPEAKLLHMAGTCLFNEPKFYGELGDVEKEIFNLVEKVSKTNPQYVLQLASYLRNEQYLRSISNALLVKSANTPEFKGSNLVSKYAPNIIKRADEITEILAMQIELFKKPIPNSLKRSIAASFSQYDEYQFAKYNRKSKVTFKDAIMLTHPKMPSEIIKKILSDDLKVPYTWETELSKGGDKKQTWQQLINSGKLPYMALIRNLRNILQADVSREYINKVISMITDEKAVKNSKMFPFRFYQAYKELEEVPHLRCADILGALEKAMEIAFSNVPYLKGSTFIACDVSGSMQSKLSKNGSIEIREVGLLLGSAAHSFTDESMLGCFGDKFKVYPIQKDSGIISNTKRLYDRSEELGCSTNGYLSIKYLNDNNIKVDRMLIFTDCQLYDSDGGIFGWSFIRGSQEDHTERTIRKEYNKYKSNINPKCKLYLFDLNSYGIVNFPESDRSVVNISGWSDKIFNFIHLYEVDPDIQVKYIKEKYK